MGPRSELGRVNDLGISMTAAAGGTQEAGMYTSMVNIFRREQVHEPWAKTGGAFSKHKNASVWSHVKVVGRPDAVPHGEWHSLLKNPE